MKFFSFLLIIIMVYTPVYSIFVGGYKIRKVVIDAGHGGKDPGALGRIKHEKDIALAIALKLGAYIEKNIKGVQVIYTRKTDKFIELYRRSEIANENNADLFISIHVNANKKKSISGTSTWVMGLNKAQDNLEVTRRENSAILIEKDYKTKYSGYDPSSPETDIILSLYQNAFLEQSIALAEKVQSQFAKRASRKSRGVRQAGLIVLWNCTMPSILIETGFITNTTEEKYLNSDYGQSIIASAIYRAFRDYKIEIEKSNFSYKNKKVKTNKKIKADKNIIYKIQIAYSVRKLETKPQNFKGIKNVKREKRGSKYRYTVGYTNSHEEIINLQKKINKKIPDAFIIAYKNGKIINY